MSGFRQVLSGVAEHHDTLAKASRSANGFNVVRVYRDPHSERSRKLLQQQNDLLNSRHGGKLLAVSVEDGNRQQVLDLQSPPVWDGMAAAYGNMFMCCRDGSVVAFNTSKALGH